jgi:hypothetical protein
MIWKIRTAILLHSASKGFGIELLVGGNEGEGGNFEKATWIA